MCRMSLGSFQMYLLSPSLLNRITLPLCQIPWVVPKLGQVITPLIDVVISTICDTM
jgi:hypothetical protein